MRERQKSRSRVVLALKILALVLCVGLLVRALSRTDGERVFGYLRAAGPWALLILVPFPLAMLSDAFAWSRLLHRLRHPVSLLRLWRVRISTEAVTNALPAGAVVSEALGPLLLAPFAPVFASLSTGAAKRWLIIRTHGYYVAIAGVVGFGILSASSEGIVHSRALPWIVFGSAAGLVGLSILLERATTRFGIAAKLHGSFDRLKDSKLLAWARGGLGERASFERVDVELVKLGRASHPVPAAALFVVWMIESLETYVILRVLGVDIDFITVMSIDASLSVVRTVAVFAPSGFGVQDLGYLAFFKAYGLPDPMALGPAFLLLKRAKELLYISLGGAFLFFAKREKPKQAPSSIEEGAPSSAA